MCLAIPGKIVDVADGGAAAGALAREGRVSFGGLLKRVNLSFVPEAGVGDYVIVHVGFAISRLDEAEAKRALREFEALDGEAFAKLAAANGDGAAVD